MPSGVAYHTDGYRITRLGSVGFGVRVVCLFAPEGMPLGEPTVYRIGHAPWRNAAYRSLGKGDRVEMFGCGREAERENGLAKG
jgi:hypothetical protein